MFANLVDLEFNELIKFVKNEIRSEKYSNMVFNEYKYIHYFKRSNEWPPSYFIRLDISNTLDKAYNDKSIFDLDEEYQNLSIKNILEKIDNNEITLCFKLISCNIDSIEKDNKIVEDHEVGVHYLLSNEDIFAEDWCLYINKK